MAILGQTREVLLNEVSGLRVRTDLAVDPARFRSARTEISASSANLPYLSYSSAGPSFWTTRVTPSVSRYRHRASHAATLVDALDRAVGANP
jgi:hypothetical protein